MREENKAVELPTARLPLKVAADVVRNGVPIQGQNVDICPDASDGMPLTPPSPGGAIRIDRLIEAEESRGSLCVHSERAGLKGHLSRGKSVTLPRWNQRSAVACCNVLLEVTMGRMDGRESAVSSVRSVRAAGISECNKRELTSLLCD